MTSALAPLDALAPDGLALLDGDGPGIDHGTLRRRAAAVARALAVAGVRAGDRVAVHMPNRTGAVVALLGALRLGATAAPLDPRWTAAERARVLDDLRPAAVVEAAGAGEADAAPVPTVSSATSRAVSPATSRATATPALVLYTSGSTGAPRGALVSHAALAWALDTWRGPILGLGVLDRVLATLPLSHAYGLAGALLAPLSAGAAVILVERFSPEVVLDAIERHGATVLPGVGTMFSRLLEAPGLVRVMPGRLRLAVSGAGPCPSELVRRWRARTGTPILRGYGMTELFRPISFLAGDSDERGEAIGRPVPGVRLRLVDEGGREAPSGATGELWIATPGAMDGYLGDPEGTAAVLRGGWFRTGDLARVGPDGLVTLEGRRRPRILRGGDSVFPEEVEAVLAAHPAVAAAAVVARPHAELGEEAVAWVELRPGATAAAEELIAHCRERLAAFKTPAAVWILPELPRSATGKVLRSRLAAPD